MLTVLHAEPEFTVAMVDRAITRAKHAARLRRKRWDRRLLGTTFFTRCRLWGGRLPASWLANNVKSG